MIQIDVFQPGNVGMPRTGTTKDQDTTGLNLEQEEVTHVTFQNWKSNKATNQKSRKSKFTM